VQVQVQVQVQEQEQEQEQEQVLVLVLVLAPVQSRRVAPGCSSHCRLRRQTAPVRTAERYSQ
jgi:hypothetical protein